MGKTVAFPLLVVLALSVQALSLASAPAQGAKPLTGDWTFILKPMDAQGNPAQDGISLQMSLQESGSLVYATWGGERLLGHREDKKLHLQFLSHGVRDTDVKSGGVQNVGGLELKLKANDTLEGEAVVVTPGEGADVFTRFEVTARRGQRSVGWSPGSICNDLHLGDLVSYVFEDATEEAFAPMNACDASKDGGGYYVFGHTGPGDPSRPFATTTVYVPIELSGCPFYHSDRTYSFTISNGGTIDTVQELEAALQAAARFLALFHVNAETFIQHVDAAFSQVPQFAISIGPSTNTYFVTLYINLGDNVPSSVCSQIQNSALVQDIQQVFDRGHGFTIQCGHSISDSYDLKRQIIPSFDWPVDCTTPVLFMYVLGTINVNYN